MYQKTDNTKKAINDLTTLSGKEVIITSTQVYAQKSGISQVSTALGFLTEEDGKYLIGINEMKEDTHESTIVHECVHAIMDLEGFPRCEINGSFQNQTQINNCKFLGGILSSAYQHPIVYSRMSSDYNLDMTEYFKGLVKQKQNLLSRGMTMNLNDIRYIFQLQQDILNAFEYHYYSNDEKENILNKLKNISPIAYSKSLELFNQNLKFNSPEEMRMSGSKIFDFIKSIGFPQMRNQINSEYWNYITIV